MNRRSVDYNEQNSHTDQTAGFHQRYSERWMNRFVQLLLLCFFLPIVGRGQNRPENPGESGEARTRYGLYGDVNANLHSAAFSALPGVPNCCPEYQSGFGFGPTLGLLYEMPLSSGLLLSLRAGYSGTGATLARDEETTVEFDGTPTPMTIEHRLTASLGNIGVEPLLGWRLNDRLSLHGGTRIGYSLGADFTQEERISDETLRGTFENGQRTRHEVTGEIPGASSIQASLLGGVSYELPLNTEGTLLMAPELFFSFALTPVSSDVTWSSHAIRAGVALKYSPKQEILPPALPPNDPTTPPTPVQPERPPVLAASVRASGLNAEGKEESVVRLQVEEFVATESYPILNYVFFDENSSALPDRYMRLTQSQTRDFTGTDLQGEGALRVYHQMLNIIGSRLRAAPGTTLRLVGTNANVGPEEGNESLSRSRAEAVRNYLRDVWGIAESRLRIENRNLPASPSNVTSVDGQNENRRVELIASTESLLSPMVIEDTARRATPPTIRFRPEVESEAGVSSWEITAMQDERVLKRLSGTGAVPEVVDWSVDAESGTMPRAPGRLFYQLSVRDAKGQTKETTSEAIAVEQVTVQKKRNDRLADVEIERYSLILFGYDESRLNSEHRTLLDVIKKKISPRARVVIRGYADRTGENERNRALSLERAQTVSKALGLPEDHVTVQGVVDPLYDNETPEGRFYSRTVTIEVSTPIVDGDSG